jgi:hypothetical protein
MSALFFYVQYYPIHGYSIRLYCTESEIAIQTIFKHSKFIIMHA